MAADGQCEKACKWGYTQTMVNGIKYCVEQCLSGWKAVDNTCVAEDAKFGSCERPRCTPPSRVHSCRMHCPGRGHMLQLERQLPAAAERSNAP
jgi:hypothetical protein